LNKTEIGIGIIGLGFVGEKAHLSAFRRIPGSRLEAIADVDQKRLQKAADKSKIKSAYSNHEDLINDSNVDAVVISVPTFLHKKIAIDAFKAGKHVLCEMPLAPNMKDAQEIVDEAKKAGVVLMPSLNFRFTPNYVKTKELIDKGSIGKPAAIFIENLYLLKTLRGNGLRHHGHGIRRKVEGVQHLHYLCGLSIFYDGY